MQQLSLFDFGEQAPKPEKKKKDTKSGIEQADLATNKDNTSDPNADGIDDAINADPNAQAEAASDITSHLAPPVPPLSSDQTAALEMLTESNDTPSPGQTSIASQNETAELDNPAATEMAAAMDAVPAPIGVSELKSEETEQTDSAEKSLASDPGATAQASTQVEQFFQTEDSSSDNITTGALETAPEIAKPIQTAPDELSVREDTDAVAKVPEPEPESIPAAQDQSSLFSLSENEDQTVGLGTVPEMNQPAQSGPDDLSATPGDTSEKSLPLEPPSPSGSGDETVKSASSQAQEPAPESNRQANEQAVDGVVFSNEQIRVKKFVVKSVQTVAYKKPPHPDQVEPASPEQVAGEGETGRTDTPELVDTSFLPDEFASEEATNPPKSVIKSDSDTNSDIGSMQGIVQSFTPNADSTSGTEDAIQANNLGSVSTLETEQQGEAISETLNNQESNKKEAIRKPFYVEDHTVPVKKRGRKSFKEMDADVDLINVPPDEVLFQKQYYPISVVAKWFRVNNSLLRFWENEFNILKPKKNKKGDRFFRPEDVKNLQLIYYLLRQKKLTINGANKHLKSYKGQTEIDMQLIQTLNEFKGFLLELRAATEK